MDWHIFVTSNFVIILHVGKLYHTEWTFVHGMPKKDKPVFNEQTLFYVWVYLYLNMK